MITSYPESFRGYIRLAESAGAGAEPKLAALAYAQALRLNPSLLSGISAKFRRLRHVVSFGPVCTANELESIPIAMRPHLFKPWPANLVVPAIEDTLWTCPTTSRERQLFLDPSSTGPRELPRFFSWIYPFRLAGMSTPRSEADIDLLIDMGFTQILTLTRESPLDPKWFRSKPAVTHTYLPLENYGTPTLAEMDVVWARYRDDPGTRWLVHCGGGVGRAGTVLACLIAMIGLGDVEHGEQGHPALDAGTAIKLLRHARPRSLESEAQEQFVSKWISHRWKMINTAQQQDNESSEPITLFDPATDVVGARLDPNPNQMHGTLLFLIGTPGSGKSWFAESIVKRRTATGLKTVVISQDESGSRAACESQLSRTISGDTLVILDRCNPTSQDRAVWLKLTDRRAIAVYFGYTPSLCRRRIDERINHPTIRAGRGANALDQMSREMQPPSVDTERFVSVITVRSFAAARQVILRLTPSMPLLKFPRTPHLLNLGATTSDDLVADTPFEQLKGAMTIEEKIDGANMGLSLDVTGTEIRVQNRSHWVSSADHAQFKPLDTWVASHRAALLAILDRDPQFPERYLLYGEWCVARHSVLYTKLPDRFIAFDLYDRLDATFTSRRALASLLRGAGVQQVPLLAETHSITREQILEMIQRPSAYSPDARVEGVYVRFEDPDRQITVSRGKVVRGDFIAGNEYWAKGPLVLNGIDLFDRDSEIETE